MCSLTRWLFCRCPLVKRPKRERISSVGLTTTLRQTLRSLTSIVALMFTPPGAVCYMRSVQRPRHTEKTLQFIGTVIPTMGHAYDPKEPTGLVIISVALLI